VKRKRVNQNLAGNAAANKGRHEYHCKICAHAERQDIEEAFINWTSPGRIAKQYGFSRDSVYRHAHALGLMERRRRNVVVHWSASSKEPGTYKLGQPQW
jgi:hypothetical protein